MKVCTVAAPAPGLVPAEAMRSRRMQRAPVRRLPAGATARCQITCAVVAGRGRVNSGFDLGDRTRFRPSPPGSSAAFGSQCEPFASVVPDPVVRFAAPVSLARSMREQGGMAGFALAREDAEIRTNWSRSFRS